MVLKGATVRFGGVSYVSAVQRGTWRLIEKGWRLVEVDVGEGVRAIAPLQVANSLESLLSKQELGWTWKERRGWPSWSLSRIRDWRKGKVVSRSLKARWMRSMGG